jgi:hypothetical protein
MEEQHKYMLSQTDSGIILIGDIVTYQVKVKNIGGNTCNTIQVFNRWDRSRVAYPKETDLDITTQQLPYRKPLDVRPQKPGVQEIVIDTLKEGDSIYFNVSVKILDEGYHRLKSNLEIRNSLGNPIEEKDTINNYAELRLYARGPSIFQTTLTRNADGMNDNFEIPIGLTYPDNELIVYNRTGNMVYSQTHYYNQFDGAGLPDGTYIYIFVYKNPDTGKTRRIGGTIWVTSQVR